MISRIKSVKLNKVKELNTDIENAKTTLSKLNEEIKRCTDDIKILKASVKSAHNAFEEMKAAIATKIQ